MKAIKQLEEGYSELISIDLQKNTKLKLLVNLIAIILAIIMVVPMNFYISIKTVFVAQNGLGHLALKLGVLVISIIAYMFLHELVHGVAMKICGTEKIKYGFTGLYAFAGSEDYYDKAGYIFIALVPVVLWGIALAVINFFVPNGWFWIVYVIQIVNVSGASGDFYVTFKFIRLPKDIWVKDLGVSMTVYSKSN